MVDQTHSSTLSQSNYEEIEAAVSATDRGRWFLAQHAQRNRVVEADRVLDALAGLEMRMQKSSGALDNDRIRGALVEMSDAIHRTKNEIGKDDTTISSATHELDSIVRATEKATSDILGATEQIQELAWTMREQGADESLCDRLDHHATQIYTACSFQDLTGQRNARVVETLRFIDGRLSTLIELWGQPDRSPASVTEDATEDGIDAATSTEDNGGPTEDADGKEVDAEPEAAAMPTAETLSGSIDDTLAHDDCTESTEREVETELQETTPLPYESHDTPAGPVAESPEDRLPGDGQVETPVYVDADATVGAAMDDLDPSPGPADEDLDVDARSCDIEDGATPDDTMAVAREPGGAETDQPGDDSPPPTDAAVPNERQDGVLSAEEGGADGNPFDTVEAGDSEVANPESGTPSGDGPEMAEIQPFDPGETPARDMDTAAEKSMIEGTVSEQADHHVENVHVEAEPPIEIGTNIQTGGGGGIDGLPSINAAGAENTGVEGEAGSPTEPLTGDEERSPLSTANVTLPEPDSVADDRPGSGAVFDDTTLGSDDDARHDTPDETDDPDETRFPRLDLVEPDELELVDLDPLDEIGATVVGDYQDVDPPESDKAALEMLANAMAIEMRRSTGAVLADDPAEQSPADDRPPDGKAEIPPAAVTPNENELDDQFAEKEQEFIPDDGARAGEEAAGATVGAEPFAAPGEIEDNLDSGNASLPGTTGPMPDGAEPTSVGSATPHEEPQFNEDTPPPGGRDALVKVGISAIDSWSIGRKLAFFS